MDFHTEHDCNDAPRPQPSPRDLMLTLSFSLSILAIATTFCIYASLICGSISITLALLARGQQRTLPAQGKWAVMISTAAIIVSVLVTAVMFLLTIRQYGSPEEFLKSYQTLSDALLSAADSLQQIGSAQV